VFKKIQYLYLLNKNLKCSIWRLAERSSYIQDARCLKVNQRVNSEELTGKAKMEVGGHRHAPVVLPPGKTRYPLYRRLGGLEGRSGRVRKISLPPGIDPRTVQPVASRYTVCAIPTREELAGTRRCLTLQARCRIPRCRYKRVRQYQHATLPTFDSRISEGLYSVRTVCVDLLTLFHRDPRGLIAPGSDTSALEIQGYIQG
jgi:hypothetical protein